MNQGIFTIAPIPLIGLLLVLITVYLNHVLANTRDKIKTRRKNAKPLIVAFNPEMEALLETNEDCRLILTEEAYKRHKRAIHSFKFYLSWIDKLRLEWRWIRLAKIKIGKKQHIPFYEQYADCGSLDKRKAIRPIVIKRIQDIISFANK
jgi:hypothetical protein